MHCRFRIVGILGIPLLLSCGNTLVGSDPADTPRSNFQILWENFDRYYALFEFKNINWNALYAVYSPQVTERTDDRALFDVMSAMLAHLKDGHVDLTTPFAYFNSANRKPLKTLDMALVKREYLNSGFQTAGNGNFTYGQMSAEIGYIHIASFSSRTGRSWWFSADREFFEAVGIPPDIPVHVAASDEPLERDVILEKAIELLN